MSIMNSSSSFLNTTSAGNSSFSSSFNLSRRVRNRNDTVLISSNTTHVLEQHGLPLPSMVKVAITNSTEHQKTTSRIDQNGFAWLVWGRKLYIWKHNQSDKRMTCRELLLPPSELVHNANLVCVVCNNGIPACIAASPEGLITYWPNVYNESMNISVSADIPGQECDTLMSYWPTGCILTTTSATVLLLKTIAGKGTKPSLVCSPFPLQRGWLGGIGRRMSVLFNPVAGQSLDMKRAKVVVPPNRESSLQAESNKFVYLLLGPSVQTWSVGADVQQSICEINGEDILRKLFFTHIWATDSDQRQDLRGIQIWLLDLACLPSRKMAILAAAKNSADTTNVVHFGIAILDEQRSRRVDEIKFIPIDHKMSFTEMDEEHLHSWKLFAINNYFYIVSSELLLIVSEKDGRTDLLDANSNGGQFIGSGLISGNCVVFASKLGILQITNVASSEHHMSTLFDSTLLEVRVPDHLSLSFSQHSITNAASDDNINMYKSAFLNYCGKKMTECHETLMNLFPPTVASLSPHDPIDVYTVGLCQKLIDDAPVSDPRWSSSFGISSDQKDHLGLKSKILIKNFLMDKKEGLELFFGFLNSTAILTRLTGTIIKEDVLSTTSVLFNCYEKIGFALALHNLQSHNQYRTTIDTAIKSIILSRPKVHRVTNLTANDLFYKDVSKIHHIIPALISLEEQSFSMKSPTEITEIIKHTNNIILTSVSDLSENLSDRIDNVKGSLVTPLMSGTNQYEFLPWLVTPNNLSCLVKQHEFTVRFIDDELIKQLRQLTDLILDGLKTNMESLIATDRYLQKWDSFEKMRLKLLKSHLTFDVDGARALAEKYIDYEILVNICYDSQETDQMLNYFTKFNNFPEYVFEWYVKQTKHTELVETFSIGKYSGRLKEFLKKYPQIAWHQMAIIDDFKGASETLKNLADQEQSYMIDKEFMLCMSMMAHMASESEEIDPNNLDLLQRDMDLLAFQKAIPTELLNKYGMEPNTMRVLSASEIIDMYTVENESGRVGDFLQAWSVCDFLLNQELRHEKHMLITVRAILSDPWDSFVADHPMDVIKGSLLYKLTVALFAKDEVLEAIFPYDEIVEMEPLQTILANDSAKFLLSACHEHLSFIEGEGPSEAEIENMET